MWVHHNNINFIYTRFINLKENIIFQVLAGLKQPICFNYDTRESRSFWSLSNNYSIISDYNVNSTWVDVLSIHNTKKHYFRDFYFYYRTAAKNFNICFTKGNPCSIFFWKSVKWLIVSTNIEKTCKKYFS